MSIVSFVGASQMFMLRQHFLTSPAAMREAALMDGCGDLRFIVSILLPLCMPALATLFLQSFIAQWNAYLWPLLVTNTNAMRTVQVGITMLTTIEGTNYEVVLAASAVAMVPASSFTSSCTEWCPAACRKGRSFPDSHRIHSGSPGLINYSDHRKEDFHEKNRIASRRFSAVPLSGRRAC